MQLMKDGPKYIAVSTFEERSLPKAAGFLWNPVRREWATPDPVKAARLIDYADKALADQSLWSICHSKRQALPTLPSVRPHS